MGAEEERRDSGSLVRVLVDVGYSDHCNSIPDFTSNARSQYNVHDIGNYLPNQLFQPDAVHHSGSSYRRCDLHMEDEG